ncbi:YlbD family protein [Metabacillus fastidiosus]|uniref:YlbD family protein n=1 Tax=Metabacillus fastidiosus TaxID=1458 RepID=UPI000825C636|nr:YlbD family protein [Metabacillus fastidiosus]MED4463337.1 YlbD family protein [Metabacillus fastidiosus]
MTTKNRKQSVEQFKQFVKKHPKLITEVRKGNKGWQELFEDWYLLGENDAIWKRYTEKVTETEKETEKKEEKKNDFFSQIVTAVKKMDAEQVNHHIHNMSSTIATLQNLVEQFGSKGTGQNNSTGNHPFSFRKD